MEVELEKILWIVQALSELQINGLLTFWMRFSWIKKIKFVKHWIHTLSTQFTAKGFELSWFYLHFASPTMIDSWNFC